MRSHGGKVCVAGSANVYVQVLLTILDISGDLSLGPVLSDRTA